MRFMYDMGRTRFASGLAPHVGAFVAAFLALALTLPLAAMAGAVAIPEEHRVEDPQPRAQLIEIVEKTVAPRERLDVREAPLTLLRRLPGPVARTVPPRARVHATDLPARFAGNGPHSYLRR